MSSSTEGALALYPLDHARALLEALGATWMARREAPFGTTVTAGAEGRLARRVRLHLAAMEHHRAEVLRAAPLFLHDPWPPCALAGALALVHLAPETIIGARGELRVPPSFAVLDALRHGPPSLGARASLDDPFLLDGRSAHATIAAGDLLGALASPRAEIRRAALLATARGHRGGPLLAAAEARLAEGDAAERLVAWYAIARAGGAEAVDRLPAARWERAAEDSGALAVAALSGSAQAARRLDELARGAAPRADWIHALGLAGRAASVEPLARAAQEGAPAIAAEALHSLYLITGADELLFAATPAAIAPSLDRLVAAARGAPATRLHLGRPLAEAGAWASHAWLRAFAAQDRGALADALPDWLLGGGYGARGWSPRSLGPVVWSG